MVELAEDGLDYLPSLVAPSKSQVDKAGACLREWWAHPGAIERERLQVALLTVWEHRASFAYPMQKVSANLRYYVQKATDGPPLVAQRHKRMPRIIEKLTRQPRMRLSQMQDVGGCRAILPNQAAAYAVFEGISRNWDIITHDDYVGDPRSSGYRAIHAIVRRDGVPVEVQLRTSGQQLWADEVERVDGRTIGYSLKDGEGPEWLLDYFGGMAELIAAVDAGLPFDVDRRKMLAEQANRIQNEIMR